MQPLPPLTCDTCGADDDIQEIPDSRLYSRPLRVCVGCRQFIHHRADFEKQAVDLIGTLFPHLLKLPAQQRLDALGRLERPARGWDEIHARAFWRMRLDALRELRSGN